MGKFYAVANGRQNGIYTDWPTAQAQISGFSGALYKSFNTRQESEAYLNQSSSVNLKSTVVEPINQTVVYTDGSGSNPNACGFGVVVLRPDGQKFTVYGRVPDSVTKGLPTNNIAELYAIYVALSLCPEPIVIHSDSQYSINTLAGLWSASENVELINAISNIINTRKLTNQNVKLQYVEAHSNVTGNNEADALSKIGVQQNYSLVITQNGQIIRQE